MSGNFSGIYGAKARRSGPTRMRSAGDELFGSALVDDHDSGSLERGGAQLEEKVGGIPAECARGLIVGLLEIPGDDGVGNAQGRLPEAVLGIELGALADQVFNDVVEPL